MADTLARLRQIARKRSELLEERDSLIVEAKEGGIPVAHIAEAAGLSRMQAHRIINEGNVDRQ